VVSECTRVQTTDFRRKTVRLSRSDNQVVLIVVFLTTYLLSVLKATSLGCRITSLPRMATRIPSYMSRFVKYST
jgi:hypothetical protein